MNPNEADERVLARLEESLWVAEARAARMDSFARLVSRHEAPLRYFLRRLLKDPERARDVYQEVWLDAWRGLPSLLVPEAFRVWLYRIARAKAARFIRDEIRRREKLEASGETESAEPAAPEPSWDAEAVHHALGQLAPRHREALTLFYLDELSLEEIAGVIERPVGTVKSRLHAARNKLREIIEKGEI